MSLIERFGNTRQSIYRSCRSRRCCYRHIVSQQITVNSQKQSSPVHTSVQATAASDKLHGFATPTSYGRPAYQMRILYFCPVVSSFLLSCFSSPNLSRRRLDVYHTSTHGAVLVRIQNAGLKCAACGSLEMQDPKNRQNRTFGHHRTTLSGYIFATKARIDNWKKTC